MPPGCCSWRNLPLPASSLLLHVPLLPCSTLRGRPFVRPAPSKPSQSPPCLFHLTAPRPCPPRPCLLHPIARSPIHTRPPHPSLLFLSSYPLFPSSCTCFQDSDLHRDVGEPLSALIHQHGLLCPRVPHQDLSVHRDAVHRRLPPCLLRARGHFPTSLDPLAPPDSHRALNSCIYWEPRQQHKEPLPHPASLDPLGFSIPVFCRLDLKGSRSVLLWARPWLREHGTGAMWSTW